MLPSLHFILITYFYFKFRFLFLLLTFHSFIWDTPILGIPLNIHTSSLCSFTFLPSPFSGVQFLYPQVLPYPPLTTPSFQLLQLTRSCQFLNRRRRKHVFAPYTFWLFSYYCSSSTSPPTPTPSFLWLLTSFLAYSPHSFFLW